MGLPITPTAHASENLPGDRTRPLARGTATAHVENRRFRLHARGEGPWEHCADDARDRINVERHGEAYVVFRPRIGALSVLDARAYLLFHVFLGSRGDRGAIARHLVQLGESEPDAVRRASELAARLEREGWLRTEPPAPVNAPLRSVYFTVTRACNLACPYCYQGLNDRGHTDMPLERARLALARIKAINPACQINVTGGEPFSHRQIRELLDLIDAEGFPFVVLTNGTFLDDDAAAHLGALSRFRYVQISLDGATAATHEMTRGAGSFARAMAGVRAVIARGLNFRLAPTLHNGNLHELNAIGDLAVANGGWLSPNHLKELPHAGLNYTKLGLSKDGLLRALRTLNEHLMDTYGAARFLESSQKYASWDPEVCLVNGPNSKSVCGMAHSLVDIDWNGDVYPCHLAKGPDLRIGNVFDEDFPAIFDRVERRGLRVRSHEIEKCSACKFVSSCAGGCRAGAWFTFGTLEHEDDWCPENYRSHLHRLLVGASMG